MEQTQFTLQADVKNLSHLIPEKNADAPDPGSAFPILSIHYDLTDDKLKADLAASFLPMAPSLLRTFADEIEADLNKG